MHIDDRAALIAISVHHDHYNKHNGELYILHLYRVSSAVRNAGLDRVHIAVAWLHDAVEDKKITERELQTALFAPGVDSEEAAAIFHAVKAISKPDDGSLTLEEYYHMLLSYPIAAKVKIFDMTDNFSRNHQIEDDAIRERMARKYSLGFYILKDYVN